MAEVDVATAFSVGQQFTLRTCPVDATQDLTTWSDIQGEINSIAALIDAQEEDRRVLNETCEETRVKFEENVVECGFESFEPRDYFISAEDAGLGEVAKGLRADISDLEKDLENAFENI